MNEGALLSGLAKVLDEVSETQSKNAKVERLSAYLRNLSAEDAALAARLATGRSSPRGSRDETQVGHSTIWELLTEISGTPPRAISELYLKHGDLGEVAQEALKTKQEMALFGESITLAELQGTFDTMARSKGKGSSSSRRALLKSLLLRSSPPEAKYVVKILTGEMRTGIVQGLVEEAIAKAYALSRGEVAKAHLLAGDIGLLAYRARLGELSKVTMTPFRPLNFMLAEPMATATEIADYFKKPIFAEYKYDGVRAQLHKLGGKVRIFSRRLEDVSESFPEVSRAAASIEHDFILDGEIVPFRDGKPLPFQLLQRRLRRIENFNEAARNAPVEYFVFDILLLDAEEFINRPLRERSIALAGAIRESALIPAERINVASGEEIARAFARSRELGYEGLVLKDPESGYAMGKRGKSWVKLKEELDTIDAVIVAAEYGHGKRAGVISDYTFAVRGRDGLKTIGKAYSGLTDSEIDSMTERIKKLTIKDYGYRRSVKPEIVLEVAFDSIQESDRHDSGYALRFPRIKRIREDKTVREIDTLEEVVSIFNSQRVKLAER